MKSSSDHSFTISSTDEPCALRLPSLQVTVTLPDRQTISAPLALVPLVLGQSDDCDLVVNDPKVSRRHCLLRLGEDGVFVEDLDSRNGTFIRDVRIVGAFVLPNVPITIGDSSLVVSASGGSTIVRLSSQGKFGNAIGESVAMRALFAKLERIAPTDETILLQGESGTGKDVLARAVHENSRRNAAKLIVVDCGAISSSTIEVELFGSVPGAATGAVNKAGLFESAHRGTIFIDEIGELPLDVQQKMLRVIEARTVRRLGTTHEQPIDVRIVAATHRNLKTMVAEGKFRQDLYYRLSVIELQVPPLRDRKDDIPLIVERFLANRNPPVKLDALPRETLPMFMGYDWPGNVRELRNALTRLVLFPELLHEMFAPVANGMNLSSEDQPSPATHETTSSQDIDPQVGKWLHLTLPEAREAVLEELERKYVAAKLRQFDGNISRTAEAMGVSRQLLHRLLDRHGMRAK